MPAPAERPGREAERQPTPGQLDLAAFAQRLRDHRARSQLSVRQAAADADVSFMTLSRVENGSQPDLATFMRLCVWLRASPEEFFASGARRDPGTPEVVARHLVADPSLNPEAAQRIADVVRDMYEALARPPGPTAAVACHLRAASVLRPGVPERLGSLLTDMNDRLRQLVDERAL